MERFHPLDKLIRDDSICLLEALVPFIDFPYKRMLIFFIKYREIAAIMDSLTDRQYIESCGFDCHPNSSEDILENICLHMPRDMSNKISQFKQMMSSFEMMNNLNNASTNYSPNNKDSYDFKYNNEVNNTNNIFQESDNTFGVQANKGDLYSSVMNILNSESNKGN